jgi:hypothetical protein
VHKVKKLNEAQSYENNLQQAIAAGDSFLLYGGESLPQNGNNKNKQAYFVLHSICTIFVADLCS